MEKSEYVKREIIDNLLLAALDDKSKVVMTDEHMFLIWVEVDGIDVPVPETLGDYDHQGVDWLGPVP